MKTTLFTTAFGSMIALSTLGQNVLTTPGFEGLTIGSLADNGGVSQWGNYNDTIGNSLVESGIFHGGTEAFELNLDDTGSAGYSLLYQNTGTSVSIDQIQNTLWTYSFWVYTTGTSGSFNYGFFPSDSFNEDQAGANGTIAASSLTADTWTLISGNFTTGTYSFNASATPDMKATFNELNSTATFYIDDVSLSPVATPEPSGFALAAFGLVTLSTLRRRLQAS